MNSILLKVEKLGLNPSVGHTRKLSGCTWYETEFGKEKGNLEAVNLMSEILAGPVLRNNYLRKLHDKKTEDRIFVVDSGASMQMLSKKYLSSDEMETLRRSRNPTTEMTANGEVQIDEEAQVLVHDLDLFVTLQFLDETPAVLSLGMLCSERGYSYVWKNGETPRLTKNGKTITCTMDNSVLLVVSRLSSYSSRILSSTSRSTDQSNYSRNLGTLSDPVTTRSDKHACGKPMLTNHDKQATGNREPSRRDEQGRSDARHSCWVTALHR